MDGGFPPSILCALFAGWTQVGSGGVRNTALWKAW